LSAPVIRVEDLGKKYRLGAKAAVYPTLRESLAGMAKAPGHLAWRVLHGQPKAGQAGFRPDFWALRHVDFDVHRGEVLGVIGRNGAGKSTVLKLLSRITEPTEGRIRIKGRVASLLEVGTGFHPELSGRENVFLNGAILGMSRAEVSRKFDEIVGFAEVEEFIDTPVKHYSSGMYTRLAFSVGAHLEPDILIVDEVLAVGDAAFQRKCLGKMGEATTEGRTVLFVTHNMAAMVSICTRAVLLRAGSIVSVGSPAALAAQYDERPAASRHFIRDEAPRSRAFVDEIRVGSPESTGGGKISLADGVEVTLVFTFLETVRHAQVAIGLMRRNGERVLTTTNMDQGGRTNISLGPGMYEASVRIPPTFLKAGEYVLNVSLTVPWIEVLDEVREAVAFEVTDPDDIEINLGGMPREGVVNPILSWNCRLTA
jgi:lipopolysaccharide transport system ATP-binding protein